jgi:hypothetical protein
VAFDVLQVERKIGDGAEEREADDEADRARHGEDAVANSSSGRIGSAARLSATTNAASRTRPPTTNASIGGEVHEYVVPPRLVYSTIAASPPARSTAPR